MTTPFTQSIRIFKVYRQSKNNIGRGIIFFVRNQFSYVPVDNNASLDPSVRLCSLSFNVFPHFNLFACYRAPGPVLSQDQWDVMFHESSRDYCVSVGDFNADNVVWNCEMSYRIRERFGRCIEAHDLFLPKTDTYSRVNFRTFTWFWHPAASLVKLMLRIVSLNASKISFSKKPFKLRSVRIDWSKFDQLFKNSYSEFFTNFYDESLLAETVLLTDIVTSTVHNLIFQKPFLSSLHRIRNPMH